MGAPATWVIGTFTGSQAQSVKAHADAGLGYFLRSVSGSGGGLMVQAAFRFVTASGPVPPHLEIASLTQSLKLDELQKQRSGIS